MAMVLTVVGSNQQGVDGNGKVQLSFSSKSAKPDPNGTVTQWKANTEVRKYT